MKKIISLFKRDYEGTRQVINKVVEGAEWVIAGEGTATIKYDGTCCMIRDSVLYKRYDRRLTKSNARRLKRDKSYVPAVEDYKPIPEGWQAAEPRPNQHTGHWPGWVLVGDGPEDKWHREAADNFFGDYGEPPPDNTYELVGPKIQGNPYNLDDHYLFLHGKPFFTEQPPRSYEGLREWFINNIVEGIVWHHPDGRMVKIKRRDFGYDWPVTEIEGNE